MVNLTPWKKVQASTGSSDRAPASPPAEKERLARMWNLGILSDPETDEVPGKQLEADLSLPY